MDESVSASVEGGDLDALIRQIDTSGKSLPEAALQAIQARPEEAIPMLIAALQQATVAVREHRQVDGNVPFFALFLLSEFQAREALPAVVEAMSLPGKGAFELFGDAVHEVWPRTLAMLADDQLELIEGIINNQSINEYVRWGAAGSFTRLVRMRRLTRIDAVERLRQLLRSGIDRADYDIVGPLVSELSSLGPKEAQAELAEAFERELADEGLIDWEFVELAMAESEDVVMDGLSDPCYEPIMDAIAELKSWPGFHPQNRPSTSPHWQVGGFEEDDIDFEDELYEDDYDCDYDEEEDDEVEEDDSPLIPPAGTIVSAPRPGRNAPCPCGSGKKYKKCCGAPGKH